ncbi:hypothetical protein R84B8_02701 [Treponema sp. R8-4-B8]
MEQKIIGTWVDSRGETWVFNSNGVLKRVGEEYKFAVTDTKLVCVRSAEYGKSHHFDNSYDISISSDGKTLILSYMVNGANSCLWLTKK